MEKYENDKNDFLQTQRIKQLDKYSISIKYSYLHSSTNRKLFHAFVYVLYLPFETRRLPFKVYCLKIIKTEPVYTCKKRLLTSFVALVSFENLYKLLLQKVGMFRIKIGKTCYCIKT